jgi:hypothetical protein
MTIEEVEQGLGLLMCAGWTLDEVLDLSWDQLTICIRCVVRVKAEQAKMAMEALSVMLGGKPKKEKKHSRNRKTKNAPNKNAADKDEQMLRSLAAAGMSISETKTTHP